MAANPPPLSTPPAGGQSNGSRKILLLVGVIVLCLCAAGVSYLIFKAVPRIKELADDMKKSAADTATAAELNLELNDETALFIRHTNQTEVIDACKEYWKNTLHKTLTASPLTNGLA